MNRRDLLALAVTLPLLAACNGTGAQKVSSSATAPTGSGTTTGTATGTTRTTIGLSYVPDVQFSPFYVALEKGYFTDAGVDVTLRHHGANEQLFGALQAGTEQVVYAGGDEAMQARSNGVPVTNVGTVYRRFPVVAVVREDSGITSPAQLKGKTIGVPGQYGESWFGLLAILSEAGLTQQDVTIQQIGYTQQAALTTKKVDAVMGYANNEPVRLAASGVPVRTFAVKGSLVSIGLNVLEANKDQPHLEGILTGLQKAVADIAADPQAAVTLSKKYVPTLTGPAQEKAALATLKATLPLFGDPATVGSQDAATWSRMSTFMKDAGLVTTAVPAEKAYVSLVD